MIAKTFFLSYHEYEDKLPDEKNWFDLTSWKSPFLNFIDYF